MGRAPCCDKNGLKKGPWTPEEDKKLIDYIQKHGYGNWRMLPKNAGLLRCGKSCRLRWTNYLRPDIKRGKFSFEEEEAIIQLHRILGNKWSVIAARLPGRTDNEIKNYWNTHIRKRLLRMGIDPVTHCPRLDLLDLSILSSSLYNQSQMNFSRLLGAAPPLLKPELLRLAASLASSQHDQIQNQNQNSYLLQNVQQTELCNPPQGENQYQLPLMQTLVQDIPFSNEAQFMNYNMDQFQPNLTADFCGQISGGESSEMPSSLTEDCIPLPSSYDNYYVSEQAILELSSETSNFQSNESNQNFGFVSVLSTPSSSPAPLNSNSTYINCSSTEDERESYCSNIFKFDIQDILDVN
ncbi:hypothetical protein SLE2022_013730 [Rubroshorea leprosula]